MQIKMWYYSKNFIVLKQPNEKSKPVLGVNRLNMGLESKNVIFLWILADFMK